MYCTGLHTMRRCLVRLQYVPIAMHINKQQQTAIKQTEPQIRAAGLRAQPSATASGLERNKCKCKSFVNRNIPKPETLEIQQDALT